MSGAFERGPPVVLAAEYWRERGGDADCDHERVFSGERHPMTCPAWHWICVKCGMDGLFSNRAAPEERPAPIDRARAFAALAKFQGPPVPWHPSS